MFLYQIESETPFFFAYLSLTLLPHQLEHFFPLALVMLAVTYLEMYKTSIYKTCYLIVHWSTTLLPLQLACFVTCMHLPITHTTNTSHHIQPLHPVITPSNYKYNHTHHHTHHHTLPPHPPITPNHPNQPLLSVIAFAHCTQ